MEAEISVSKSTLLIGFSKCLFPALSSWINKAKLVIAKIIRMVVIVRLKPLLRRVIAAAMQFRSALISLSIAEWLRLDIAVLEDKRR